MASNRGIVRDESAFMLLSAIANVTMESFGRPPAVFSVGMMSHAKCCTSPARSLRDAKRPTHFSIRRPSTERRRSTLSYNADRAGPRNALQTNATDDRSAEIVNENIVFSISAGIVANVMASFFGGGGGSWITGAGEGVRFLSSAGGRCDHCKSPSGRSVSSGVLILCFRRDDP